MSAPSISDEQWADLLATRAADPGAVAKAYAGRRRPGRILNDRGTLFLVAADHPARGALASGDDPMAMADRRSLLARLVEALGHPDVDGVLGTPDVVEELLLLGALEDKVVIGSMNRGGLDGATWTMDDRFTGYDAATIAECGLEGGKMLLRIDDTRRRHRRDPRGLREGGHRARRPRPGGDGRAAALPPRDRRLAAAAQGRCRHWPGRSRSPAGSGRRAPTPG